MKPIASLSAALALALAAASFAPLAEAKETPPAPSAPKPFKLPAISEFKLANGLDVTLVPYGNVPKVTILAAVRTGNVDDGQTVWLSDFTGALMQKGAAGKNASQLAEAAAAMGGMLALSVGQDATTARMDVLSEFAPQAVALMADLLRRPDFPATELPKVRADLLRTLSVGLSTPDGIASQAYNALLFPDHPYGRVYPTADQLKGYSLDQAKAFHAANFGAARTRIYVVGRYDEAAMRSALAASFGDWAPGAAPASYPVTKDNDPRVVLIDRPGAPQSTLRIGQRVSAPLGEVELEAADTLLGGYFSSRITRNIREDKGYTYSPFSSLSRDKFASNWTQQADVTAEATGPSLVEIFKEIERMRGEPPSEAEVTAIRNYLSGTFVLGLASRASMASRLASLDLLGLGPAYLNTYVGKVGALRAADFQQAAKRYLAIKDMSVVVIGPLDSVRPQLAKVPEIAGRLPK